MINNAGWKPCAPAQKPATKTAWTRQNRTADVLRQIGCTQAAEILTNSATEAQAKQRIAEGANLA